jgi:aryl-alcohol dehydrogenase-like predicted oxidoreductase
VYGFGRSEQILGRALEISTLDPKFGPTTYRSYLRAAERLDALDRQRFGKRLLHLALRWLLDQPGVAVALWGARSPKQLEPLAQTLGWSLDDEARRAVDQILAEEIITPLGAGLMAPP